MAEARTDKMGASTKGIPSKSAKISVLTAAGSFSRRQIADFLGTIPQHVRNVQGQASKKVEAAQQSTHVELGAGGRIVIPAAIREAMGIKDGYMLIARFEDGQLKLMSNPLALPRAREHVRKFVPPGDTPADRLIPDRRR